MSTTTNSSTASLAWDAPSASAPRSASHLASETPLAALSRLGREAASTDAPRAFALEAARTASVQLGASHYGVTEIVGDGQTLSVHLHRQDQAFSFAAKKFDVSLDATDSLSASVLRHGTTLVVGDLATSGQRDEELEALGLSAAILTPLASQTHSYGALGVYHDAAKSFEPEQVLLLEAIANLVTATLGRSRAESAAEEQDRFEKALFDSAESIVVVLEEGGNIRSTNQACHAVTGFTTSDLIGRSMWSALMLPEEISVVRRAMARVIGQRATERFETYILTSDGMRRRVAWTAAPLAPKGSGKPATILTTGIDITDRCEAVERAARAEAMAHDARRLCHELQDRIRAGDALFEGSAQSRRLPPGVDYDRRARSRQSYPYAQRIAPMRGAAMPDDTQFEERMCYDISSRGFSFLAPNQPDYHKIVVAFGSAPSLVYVTAEVRHATRREQNGRAQYIVGCRYTGRVTKRDRRVNDERGA